MKRALSLFLFLFVMPFTGAFAQGVVAPPVILDPDITPDREPAIIVGQNATGVDRVIAAWIRGYGNTDGHLQVAAVNAPNMTGSSNWEKSPLPCPPAMAACDCSGVSGDPILAEDAYSNPKRVYLIGASRRVSYCDANHRADENQISVWSTVDGGSSWSNYAALDHQSDGTWVTDKPSIAVSSEPTTRGRVYAAHIRTRPGFDCGSASPTNRKIIVTRVDGMLAKEIDSLSPCASSPIMLVDSAHADWLYVVWIDWATNQIKVLTSFDGFANFNRDEIAAGTFLGPAGADAIENGSGATINARSMLTARFNSITGTVGITWHARETSENVLSSDVKFVEFTPYTRTFGTIRTVTDSQSSSNPGAPTSGAQWNPALDYDSSGDYVVSYCDTRGLAQSDSQFNYDVKTARIKPWGTRSGPVDRRLTPSASNLKLYDIPRNGEYMDIWHWNGKFW